LLIYALDRDRSDEALLNLRRAYELNPHDTSTLTALGLAETVAGRPHVAIEPLERALRLSPRDLTRHSLFLTLTIACLGARQYANGVEYGLRGVEESPASAALHLNLAMCLVGLGEIARAKAALEEARRCEPDLVQRWLDGMIVFRKPEDLHRVRTFLRVAMDLDDPSAAEALR
jgi:tetratricopeptide (TPR) repeat protein